MSETATAAPASGLSAEQARVWTVALCPLTSRAPPSNSLHLREAAIHKQFRSCDVACIVGGEKHDGLGDLVGDAKSAERDAVGDILQALLTVSEEPRRPLSPGVSMEPGLTAFSRMRRSFKSVVHVRTNERIAALVAL